MLGCWAASPLCSVAAFSWPSGAEFRLFGVRAEDYMRAPNDREGRFRSSAAS
jgi:hypothetical protein